ncbi:UPF0764 protein C16orf89 homolog [Pomacea canaliculata]|uniref:UPF0764 protein C16orf89 homolog n=1 Tax=Pomacea canaliculata TaxID=400727 RepID=UPI000D73A904|nr:UPF0764 protein C16orf89 homolog [Pomacea canaliculata]XP_025091336.1 UPF0764 protein C16orf89 homolog [Pomacea canaliculata]
MSAAHFPQTVGFVVLLLFAFWGDVASVPSDSDARLLSRVIEAVQKGLEFFSEDYSDINVDGLFGLRIGQGQIVAAVEECKASGGCPKDLQPRLEKISDGVEQTSAAAMSYVELDDPDYFKRFLYIINSPYLLQYRPKKMKNLDSTPAGHDATYDEETGDACFARIMGTYEENGRKVSKCNFAKSCWDLVSKKDTSNYSITHQLLYFILVEKTGCVEELEKATGASVQDIQDRFCGSIYNEVLREVKDGAVDILNQDLFLEQVMLCGILGYEDFVQRDWIEMVLKWQRPNGCFSLPKYLVAMEKKIEDNNAAEKKLLKDLQDEVEMINKQHPTSRKLMRETVMNDGCLAHKSGLGFGTLCLYLRYLVRQNYVSL